MKVQDPPEFGGGQFDVNSPVVGLGVDSTTFGTDVLFAVTKFTKFTEPGGGVFFGAPETLVASLAGAASLAAGASNQPQSVDRRLSTGDVYMVVDGTGTDFLLKVALNAAETALDPTITSTFALPSTEIGGATIAVRSNPGEELYVADNSGFPKTIKQISFTDGSVLQTITLPNSAGDIGGVAFGDLQGPGTSTTPTVFAYERNSDTFFVIDLENTSTAAINRVQVEPDFQQFLFPPGGADALHFVTLTGPFGGSFLVAARGPDMFIVDPDSGQLLDAFGTALEQIEGMGGGSFLIADQGGGFIVPRVYEAALPDEPDPINHIAGPYTLTLTVDQPGGSDPAPATADFTLSTVDTIVVAITSPVDGSSVTSSKVDITGTANDPALGFRITNDAMLGLTNDILIDVGSGGASDIFADPTADAGLWIGFETLWHVAASSPPALSALGTPFWYYGIDSQNNFDTGFRTTGDLTTPQITIGAGTVLTFDTIYQTEPSSPPFEIQVDLKQVRFCASSCQIVATLVDIPPQAFGQSGGAGTVIDTSFIGHPTPSVTGRCSCPSSAR